MFNYRRWNEAGARKTKEKMIDMLKTVNNLSGFDYDESPTGFISTKSKRGIHDVDDLKEAVKQAYNNFGSNVKTVMAHMDRLRDKNGDVGVPNPVLQLEENLRFLTTYFRCMLRCCIQVFKRPGDRILVALQFPRPAIHRVARVGSLFSYLALNLGRKSGFDMIHQYASDNIRRVRDHAGEDYLDVINTLSFRSPSNYYFFPSQESVQEFLDQVLDNFHDLRKLINNGCCDNLVEGDIKMIEALTEDLSFMRNLLLFSYNKENQNMEVEVCLVKMEAIVAKAAYISCFYWIKARNHDAYQKLTRRKPLDDVKSDFYIQIRETSLVLLKNAPLSRDGEIEAATGIGRLKEQFETLYQTWGSRIRSQFQPINHPDEQETLDVRIKAVARKIGSLIYRSGNENTPRIFCRLSDLLMKVMLLEALVLIQYERNPFSPALLGDSVCAFGDHVKSLCSFINERAIALKGPHNDELKYLIDDLWSLNSILIHYPSKYFPSYGAEEKLSDSKLEIEVVVRITTSLFHQIYNNVMNKSMPIEMDILLRDLDEDIKLIQAKLPEVIFVLELQQIRKTTPKTDQLGFSSLLLEKLRELICCKKDLDMDLKVHIQSVCEDLEFFRSHLQYITENHMENYGSKDISKCIRYAPYDAEYLIESWLAGACPVNFRSLWISCYAEQMKLAKAVAAEIKEKKTNNKEINVVNDDCSHLSISQASVLPTTTDLVVGFEDEMDLIKQKIVSDRKELDVVSIVGMPGLGKTTLAKKVYEDPLTVDHFYVRAWCYVSQQYKKRELILTILSSILELTDLFSKTNEDELAVKLHKELMGRRYFIVLDDVWGMDAWEDLKRLFPNSNNGSRLMLTSRIKLDGAKYSSEPLELRFLSDEESWDLLQKKVFLKDQCPQELCEIGKQIAWKCKGLPLAIVVVAGILAKSGKKRNFWNEVAGNLTTHIGTGSQISHILELSYKHLPDYLKPLFLYMGAFPEDTEIPTRKLIWLWIAEGLLYKNKLDNVEAQAEFNLQDLMDRSLVMPAKKGSNGRVKTCRIHDLIRDLCLAKAEEDSFLQPIHVYDKLLNSKICDHWRLNICPERDASATAEPAVMDEVFLESYVPHTLRSILFFNNGDTPLALWTNAIESIARNSKLLRVLHNDSSSFGEDFSPHLLMLIHLRYVSVRVLWSSIPSSISNLWNLETLIIKGLKGEIVVPDAIWDLVKLRHLHINDRANFTPASASHNSSKLESLESLSTPVLSYGEEKKLLRRLPNLKRLRCIFLGMRDPLTKCNKLPQLEILEQLESLKVFYNDKARHPCQFILPSSLKKLSLSNFRLRWKDISRFQELPNLEVLKLLYRAVGGEVWDMGDVELPKLKNLKLESLNIKHWNASADNFPCLEKLVLERCRQLEEIPSGLGKIDSLERIEVVWCNRFVAKSAKRIRQEQEDLGNPLLKVHIYPPSLDS